MQLVERHVIKQSDPRFAVIDSAAFASKNLYNAANYMVRQSFIGEGVYFGYHEMHRRMKDHEAYQALPAKVSQWVLRIFDQNWQSFFVAFAAWHADHSRFRADRGCQATRTSRRAAICSFTRFRRSAFQRAQGLIVPSMLGITVRSRQTSSPAGTYCAAPRLLCSGGDLRAGAHPCGGRFRVPCGRDLGIDNLATLTSAKVGFMPRVVNGRPVKSINQFYNKRRAELQSRLGEAHTSRRLERLTTKRTRRIDHELHTASRRIMERASGTITEGSATESRPTAYYAAEPVHRVVPRLLPAFLAMIARPATMEVRVTIDKTGRVTQAQAVPHAGVNKLVLEQVVTAARAWTFKPAHRGDEPVQSELVLQFYFAP